MDLLVTLVCALLGILVAYSLTLSIRAAKFYRIHGVARPMLRRQEERVSPFNFQQIHMSRCEDEFFAINDAFFRSLGAKRFQFEIQHPHQLRVKFPMGDKYIVRMNPVDANSATITTHYFPSFFHYLLLPGFFIAGTWFSLLLGIVALIGLTIVDALCAPAGIVLVLRKIAVDPTWTGNPHEFR